MELFNNNAEQSVLGALMIQADAFDQIHWLQPEMFHDFNHRYIFNCLKDMISNNRPVDIITVAECLENGKKLAQVGGLSYIGSLVTNSAGAANIKRYAEIIQEKFINRSMIAIVEEIKVDLHSAGNIYEKLNRAQTSILSITEKAETNEPQFVGDLLSARMERIDQAYQGNIKLVKTGLNDLDRQLGGGVENGALIIVAARPSMGKTSLAIQLAENIQIPEAPALVFTIEMVNGQVVDRLIATKSRISSDKLRTGNLNNEDWDKITNSMHRVKSLNILLDDKTHTLNGMRAKARSVKRKYGLSCIVVDYIGLMIEEGDSREQQISNISRGLKALGKELDVPMIALSQLSRKVEERTNKRPVMSDLRDSGAIEQDADVIMFIYRDEYYNPDSQYNGIAEINVIKNRNGATGNVITTFDKEHTQFFDFAGTLPEPKQIRPSRRGFNDD